MQTETKILLTIKLEGVLSHRSEKREAIPYSVENFDGKKVNGVSFHHPKLEASCVQKTALSVEAYNHFISDEVPSWMHKRLWSRIPPRKRLILHLQRIAEGREFSFEILKD